MLTTHHDIDVSPGGVPLLVHVSQYDVASREIVFHLISSSGQLDLPSGVRAEVRGTKPDGNGFSYGCVMSGADVTVSITEQMCAVAGTVPCELVIYVGTPATEAEPASQDFQQLCTATFFLKVKRAALDKDTLGSNSEIRQLVTVIDHTAEIIAAAQLADAACETVEEYKNTAQAAKESALAAAEATASDLEAVNHKAEQIVRITTDADTVARQALEKAGNAENEAAETANAIGGLRTQMEEVMLKLASKVDDAYLEDGYQFMTSDGVVIVGPLGPFAGGGGGGGGGGDSNHASLSVTNTSGWLSKTIASGGQCPISLTWSSIEDDMPTGNGTLRITVNGIVRATLEIQQGEVTVDLARYCGTGSNVCKVQVSDIYGNARTINFSVTVTLLSISSSFDSSTPYTGAISFPYTPLGAVAKTVRFILDGTEIGTQQTSVSGRQMSYTIPAQSHGAHNLRVYFEAEINGETVRSNELYYEFISVAPLNDTVIIACGYRGGTESQYDTVQIPYMVYDPNALTAEVQIYVGQDEAQRVTVDRTEQVFSYRANDPGETTVSIVVGNTIKIVTFTVDESDIHVEAETENLSLFLTSQGRSNQEEHPEVWSFESISATLSDFNYTSDGWQRDADGITALRVTGDARVTIPYQPFATDFRASGKTIEIEFATRNVMNYDATIMSCMADGRGFSLTAQKALMKSEQSEISTQYKEDEHVRISFVVEKRSGDRLLLIYINGIASGAVQYPQSDDFSQASPVNISIGSSDCTIDVYNIRIYDNDLNRTQILDNWIADTQVGAVMLERFTRNNVYDAYGNVVISQLPGDLPYMILECPELPQYKGDKKTISGSYTDPVHPAKSFSFEGAQIDVQGTSSQYYPRKNYKIKFKQGFRLPSGATANKYAINTEAVPTSAFCFKADVASSEGANNVELVRLYNSACPYKTPAQTENPKVRQGIDGFPIVIFWNDGEETVFIGKYNFNNDKGTEEVFGFVEGDESWEIRNNTSDRVLWKSDDYSGSDWLNDFEARYPDTDPAYEDPAQLAEFAAWIKSTDPAQATGDALPETVSYTENETTSTFTHDTADYRRAKFRAELSQYAEMDSALFSSLFTEAFLMVDSRAKNAFPSFIGTEVEET